MRRNRHGMRPWPRFPLALPSSPISLSSMLSFSRGSAARQTQSKSTSASVQWATGAPPVDRNDHHGREPNMTRPKGTLHQVPLVASNDADGSTRFTAGSELWDHPAGALRFHKDHHGMKTHDYHLVEFVLDDRTGQGLKFPATPHDAMWVAAADKAGETRCPDGSTESNYEVIEPICVCDAGRRLIVRNDNPRQEQWAFTLNFVKPGAEETDAGS